MGKCPGMRKLAVIGALLLAFVSAPAIAAELSVEYPQNAFLGEWVQVQVTSDEPLLHASAVVTLEGKTSPVGMFRVDERAFRVAFVPEAERPGLLSFYVVAITQSGEVLTHPAGAPEEPLLIALLRDTVAPDFVLARAPERITVNRPAAFVFRVPESAGTVEPGTVEVRVDGEPARSVSATPNMIMVEHVFTTTGRHVIEVRGEDRWGNAGSREFQVTVRGPSFLQTGLSLRTDASAGFGAGQQSPGVVTRLDASVRAGSLLSLSGHAAYPLLGGQGGLRYGLQGELNLLRIVRLQGNLGEFTAKGASLVLDTKVWNGLGFEADVWPVRSGIYTGVVRQGSGGAGEEAPAGGFRYERNVLGARLGVGSLFTLGGALVSDRYLDFCELDADGCALPAKARSNAVIGADLNLGLLGFRLANSLAASINMPRISRAVPYTGGPVVLAGEEIGEQTRVTPSEFLPAGLYHKFPIPQFTLAELIDTTNPAIVPGVAYQGKLTLPQLLGVRVEGTYKFADSGFDSLVAPGPKGVESLSAKASASLGRWLRITVEGEDRRKVEKNLLLDVLIALVGEMFEGEEGGSESGDGSGADVTELVERTQKVSASLALSLGRLTLRPQVAYEITGVEEFGPRDLLFMKSPGAPIPEGRRKSHEARIGGRVENLRLGPARLTVGYFAKAGTAYVDGSPQDPVRGSASEVETQIGAVRFNFEVDQEPLENQRTQRVGAAWNGEVVSLGAELGQLYTSNVLAERRVELSLSAHYPLGGLGAVGGGANFALVSKAGEESAPSGSVYLYHQWSF